MRAIIYAAVSTPGQAEDDKESIPAQLGDGRAAARRLGATIVAEVVIPGHSRNYTFLHQLLADCPEYRALVELIEADAADLIIARNWDRLVRTLDLSNDVDRLLHAHNVQVYLLNAPTPPLSPEEFRQRTRGQQHIERLPRFIQGWTAESETIERVARHAVGMRGRIARGLHGACSSPPYGYRLPATPSSPMLMDPAESHWVRWMFQRRLDRVGYTRIAKELNAMGVATQHGGPWAERTVRGIINNPFYAGIVHWGGYTNEGIHEPAITRELWEEVRRVNRARTIHRARTIRPLSGLCRCAHCGWGMAYSVNRRGDKERIYLRCSQYNHAMGQACVPNSNPAWRVEGYVLERIRAYLNDPNLYYARLQKHYDDKAAQQRLATLEDDLDALKTRADRLTHGYLSGLIDDHQMRDHRDQITTARTAIQAERDQLLNWQTTAAAMTRQVGELRSLLDQLDTLPPRRLNKLYAALIAKIILDRNQQPRLIGHLGEDL